MDPINLCETCTKADKSCPVWVPNMSVSNCAEHSYYLPPPVASDKPKPVYSYRPDGDHTKSLCRQCTLAPMCEGKRLNRLVFKCDTHEPVFRPLNPVSQTPDAVEETLAERGATYGDANYQFTLAQAMKDNMRLLSGDEWLMLPAVARESLDMIVHKMSRVICGDHTHADSWHDIAGYAKLAEKAVCKDG